MSMSTSTLKSSHHVTYPSHLSKTGWATYENNRGFGWYEELNPSEVFGDIMIDYSYVECSMASLTALAEFHEKFPQHRSNEVAFAIRRGGEFMKSIQREDGSWCVIH
jgi:cycloartenol synthase